jgi:hypothetical protein
MPPRGKAAAAADDTELAEDAGEGTSTATDTSGDEPSAVSEPGEGELAEAVESLGKAVDANENQYAHVDHDRAMETTRTITEQLELSAGELVFDVRDFLLDKIKHRPKPWSATSQAEQRDVAADCEHAAKELVRQVVEAVAARGADPIRVLLTKVNAGGDDIVITGKVKFLDAEPTERDTSILALHHAIGKHVMLTRATVDDYSGGGREPETDPDEPGFGFEAGDEEEE